jgi:hypothetical protein
MAGIEKMDNRKEAIGIFVAAIFLVVLVAPVNADWDEGDSYKMHFPQLPDPNGFDIANYHYFFPFGEPLPIADDWLCTETSPVTDIHIWGSWTDDNKGEIVSFNVSIWSSNNSGNFSHPGELLWQHTFSEDEFTERYWGNGTQGSLYSASNGGCIWGVYPQNHNDTWQYNLHINDPTMSFVQEKGTTYWLAISPEVNSSEYLFGWKTSEDAWTDSYVAQTFAGESEDVHREGIWWGVWFEMNRSGYIADEQVDLAFVIDGPPSAPEVPLLTPAGLLALVGLLAGIAGIHIAMRKRR